MTQKMNYLGTGNNYFNSFLIEIKCESITIGTMQHGSQTKGKYSKAIFGWSKANF